MARNPNVTNLTNFAPVGSHTEVTDLSSAVALTRPAGATQLWLQALAQNVRYRLDGTNPDSDTGFQLAAGDAIVFPVAGADVRVIEETASANIEYQWLG